MKLSRVTNYNKVKNTVKEKDWVAVKLKKKIIVEITL